MGLTAGHSDVKQAGVFRALALVMALSHDNLSAASSTQVVLRALVFVVAEQGSGGWGGEREDREIIESGARVGRGHLRHIPLRQLVMGLASGKWGGMRMYA